MQNKINRAAWSLIAVAALSMFTSSPSYSADKESTPKTQRTKDQSPKDQSSKDQNSKTVIKAPAQKQKLLGKHMLSLQWLQYEKNMYGQATVQEKDGVLYLKGEQRLKGKTNGYLTIDGRITEVGAKSFKFNGTIRTSVSHINNGEVCVREGDMNFLTKGNRKYWRLQEMKSPCSEVTDYVDLYFQ